MAVTILTTPKAYSASDNPLSYTFSSNATGGANFSYVVETYYNAVKVGEDRVYLTNGIYGQIDISTHIASLVSSGGKALTTTKEIPVGSIHIKVYESYGTPPVLHSSAISATTKVFKAQLAPEQFINIDFNADWKLTKWLTNSDRQMNVLTGSDCYLSMIQGTAGGHYKIDYYSGGALLGTVEDDTLFEIVQINSNNDLNGYSSATSCVVTIEDEDPFFITFITPDCGDYNMVYWLNDYGAIDQFLFTHSEQEEGSTVSEGYSKHFGAWSGSAYQYSTNAGMRNSIVTTTRKITLNSDYMSSTVQNWLNEVVQSPRHWIGLMPWKLTTASYTDEDDRFEDLISYSLSFEHIFTKQSPTL